MDFDQPREPAPSVFQKKLAMPVIAEDYLDSSLDQSGDDRFHEVRDAGRTVTLGGKPSLKPKKKAKRKRIKIE